MLKYISLAAAVGLIVLASTHDASAGRRCRRSSVYYYYSSPPAASPVYSGTPANASTMAQAPGAGYTYRSYSYDSGPVYQSPGPAATQPLAPSQTRFFRADRKAHGLSWYQNRW